jgi:hypothetical protein
MRATARPLNKEEFLMINDCHGIENDNKGPKNVATTTTATTTGGSTEDKKVPATTPDVSDWDVINLYGNDTII